MLEPADSDRNPEEGQWVQGKLDVKQINRGENQLEMAVHQRASASCALKLDTAQLHVRCESSVGPDKQRRP